MCTVCGCGTASVEAQKTAGEKEGAGRQDHAHSHGHSHSHGAHDDHPHHHDHSHEHHHHHAHEHRHGESLIDFGSRIAGVHVPGMTQERIVRIERDILSKNDAYARQNRAFIATQGVLALNFVSSPGSGKTTLLVRTINDLLGKIPVAVIEGDQQTSNDAE